MLILFKHYIILLITEGHCSVTILLLKRYRFINTTLWSRTTLWDQATIQCNSSLLKIWTSWDILDRALTIRNSSHHSIETYFFWIITITISGNSKPIFIHICASTIQREGFSPCALLILLKNSEYFLKVHNLLCSKKFFTRLFLTEKNNVWRKCAA